MPFGFRTPTVYRTTLTSADVIAVPGTVTCTKLAGGAATAGTYTTFVVAGNLYGRTTAKQGDVTVVTETTNLTVRAAWAAVTGATFYDLFCSTAGAAALWVGRITEAQRAAGGTLTAVNTYSAAGGIAGAIDIEVPGTGLAVNAGQVAVNTAYSIPAAVVDCRDSQYVDFDIAMTRTGEAVALALTIVPFFYNTRAAAYYAGAPISLTIGGTSGSYYANQQRLRIECRGNSALALLIAAITGTGANVEMDATVN